MPWLRRAIIDFMPAFADTGNCNWARSGLAVHLTAGVTGHGSSFPSSLR